ncbi:histidine--tRNA ligase [Candidatus Poriferisocius sp.]|uniref:histidine--tRNA ligase n=1 Tax=Candidatus Poriferisocius sp. TaxID=3101276 RepID=UPI003B5B6145
MPEVFQAPKGTRDILPPESDRWQALVAVFADVFGRAGYGLVQNPMFEDIGVFQRLGEGTEVVRKEMYDFFDKGDRHLALRPEGTASVVRAFNQHRPTVPWKVWYLTPCFRYEEPQAGRFRQHHQVGAEAIGSADPDLDVEVIALQHDFYRALGLSRLSLRLNSMGSPGDRQAYAGQLAAWLGERLGELDEADRANAADHPLRVLDSKRERTMAVVADAPRITDGLSADAAAHFERVQAGLDALGVAYEIDPRLVRGLDYYTHSTWEFAAGSLTSAQNAVGGGGRYDGLAEALGGKATPGVGFGAGIERILLAADAEDALTETAGAVDVFVVDVTGGDAGRDLTFELRRNGISADRAFDARSMKAQMKVADRSGARLALLMGDDELAADIVTVRDLRSGEGQTSVSRSEVVAELTARLAENESAQ